MGGEITAIKSKQAKTADVGAAAAAAESDEEKKRAVTFDATANNGAISHQLKKLKNLKSALGRKA